MPVAEVGPLFASIPLMQAMGRRHFGMAPDELAAWAIKQLVRACSARIDNGLLLNDG
jgi:hypothetical protein